MPHVIDLQTTTYGPLVWTQWTALTRHHQRFSECLHQKLHALTQRDVSKGLWFLISLCRSYSFYGQHHWETRKYKMLKLPRFLTAIGGMTKFDVITPGRLGRDVKNMFFCAVFFCCFKTFFVFFCSFCFLVSITVNIQRTFWLFKTNWHTLSIMRLKKLIARQLYWKPLVRFWYNFMW